MSVKKLKSRYFTAEEVTNFRRLCKVNKFNSFIVSKDLFAETDNNVETLIIYLRSVSGKNEKDLGYIARTTKSHRISYPSNDKIAIMFKKNKNELENRKS